MSDTEPILDVRGLPCAVRRATIFEMFDLLQDGRALQIVNDHDPGGLRRHFETHAPGCYDWAYLVAGPEEWRVRITRV
ncbi:DUF2249 domain-containing protein [Consotaella aegiceratis]|uniref:DUF2249 domain-containing protein n=1 Tax=Consotaella aegiceratis TaxID=3097961 RepID=UPI002F3EE2CF